MRGKKRHEWPPCVRCQDPNGYRAVGGYAPSRFDGAQFGLGGELCAACYLYLKRRRAGVTERVSREALGLARLALAFAAAHNAQDRAAANAAYRELVRRARDVLTAAGIGVNA